MEKIRPKRTKEEYRQVSDHRYINKLEEYKYTTEDEDLSWK